MAIKIPRGEIQMPSVARNTNMMDLATVGSRATTSSLSELASTLFEIDKVNTKAKSPTVTQPCTRP